MVAKLVTREAKDVETLIAVLFLKRTQTCVLRRKASGAGEVDDQADLIFELREVHRFTGDRLHGKVCKAHSLTLSLSRLCSRAVGRS